MMKNKTVIVMTDRVFTSPNVFEVSDRRFGDITVECWAPEIINIDINGSEQANFHISPIEFQAMFDWAKAQGFVK